MTTPLDKPPLAPDAAREREELLRFTFESAPVGIYMADLEERYLKVNIAYQRMVGYSEEELRDKSIFSLTHPDDLPRDQVLRGELIAGKREFFEIEKRYYAKSGGLIWVRNKVSLITNSLGGPPITITVSQDITERELAEQARQDSERRLRQALEDRERLAQDLHDGIVQQIYAIGLGLEETQRRIAEDAQAAGEGLADAIAGLNTVIREVRRHITGSAPQILDGEQLRVELQALARTLKGGQRLRFRVEVDPKAVSRLPPDAATQVLNIAREAMSNSLRHSRASNGLVSMRPHRHGVRLTVEDDGIGFDPRCADSGGQGLRNIAARARQLSARLDVSSGGAGGTRIVLDIPVEMHDAE